MDVSDLELNRTAACGEAADDTLPELFLYLSSQQMTICNYFSYWDNKLVSLRWIITQRIASNFALFAQAFRINHFVCGSRVVVELFNYDHPPKLDKLTPLSMAFVVHATRYWAGYECVPLSVANGKATSTSCRIVPGRINSEWLNGFTKNQSVTNESDWHLMLWSYSQGL